MNCKKCGHEFCWLCKQNYKGHTMKQCFAHNVLKFGIVLYILIGVLNALDLDRMLLFGFQRLSLLFGRLLIYDMLVIVLYFAFYFLRDYFFRLH